MSAELEILVGKFRALGVTDPEAWAASQLVEGIDQLSRATLLRAMADLLNQIPDILKGAENWETQEVRTAIKNLGQSSDLEVLTKYVGYALIFDLLTLLEGASEMEVNPGMLNFGLFKLDDDFEPVSQVEGLHESWLEATSTFVGEDVVRF